MRWVSRGLVCAAAVSLLACGDSSSFSDRLAARLRSCDLIGEGPISEGLLPESGSQQQRCVNECILAFDCGALNATICGESERLRECADACEPRFVCDGERAIPERNRCDGDADCVDGSDETGCEDFRCDDGSEIPAAFRCDFDRDCADGSDEQGCPSGFLCSDGRNFPDSARCNGVPDCGDSADEAGCPQFICDDGSVLIATERCDLFPDCPDGSDEVGCAPPLAVCLM
ncbi:MAG: LDL receptor domain-containing protein [Myxococcota bacterium]